MESEWETDDDLLKCSEDTDPTEIPSPEPKTITERKEMNSKNNTPLVFGFGVAEEDEIFIPVLGRGQRYRVSRPRRPIQSSPSASEDITAMIRKKMESEWETDDDYVNGLLKCSKDTNPTEIPSPEPKTITERKEMNSKNNTPSVFGSGVAEEDDIFIPVLGRGQPYRVSRPRKPIQSSPSASEDNTAMIRKKMKSEWETYLNDLLKCSEDTDPTEIPSPEPKTITERKEMNSKNKTPSVFGFGVAEEDEIFIPVLGRGQPNRMSRPRKPIQSSPSASEDITAMIRKTGGLYFRNAYLEQRFRYKLKDYNKENEEDFQDASDDQNLASEQGDLSVSTSGTSSNLSPSRIGPIRRSRTKPIVEPWTYKRMLEKKLPFDIESKSDFPPLYKQ